MVLVIPCFDLWCHVVAGRASLVQSFALLCVKVRVLLSGTVVISNSLELTTNSGMLALPRMLLNGFCELASNGSGGDVLVKWDLF